MILKILLLFFVATIGLFGSSNESFSKSKKELRKIYNGSLFQEIRTEEMEVIGRP